MTQNTEENLKTRQIVFCDAAEQAQHAAAALKDIPGVQATEIKSENVLEVSYDLRKIRLEIIEHSLTELGFHIDNSLMSRLRRALNYYTEETQCANMGIEHDLPHSTQAAHVQSYQQRPHGCRDLKPRHWRKYQ